jgi:DNA-binding CsgD family transcriptional regulator
MIELAATPRPAPSCAGYRRILVCLTPPPTARMASRLLQSGPPDSIRIAATMRQIASAVSYGWPDVVVADVVTAQGMGGMLARFDGHRADLVTVAATDANTFRAVVTGLTYIQPVVFHPGPRLTARQSQVLDLLCDGLTNQQIADRLTIGIDTVKTHIAHLRDLLDATTRTHLATRAISRGLATPR